jgi:hypothetical protein
MTPVLDVVFFACLMVGPLLFASWVVNLFRAPKSPTVDLLHSRLGGIEAGQRASIRAAKKVIDDLKRERGELVAKVRRAEQRERELLEVQQKLMNRVGAAECELSARKNNLLRGYQDGR